MFAELFASSAVIIGTIIVLIIALDEARARIDEFFWHWRARFAQFQWQKRMARVRHNQRRFCFAVHVYVRYWRCTPMYIRAFRNHYDLSYGHVTPLRRPVIRHAMYRGYFPITYERKLRQ